MKHSSHSEEEENERHSIGASAILFLDHIKVDNGLLDSASCKLQKLFATDRLNEWFAPVLTPPSVLMP